MDCSEAGKVRMMATKTHRTEVTRDLPLMVICAPEQSCPIVWHFSPGDKSNHVFLNMWTSDKHTIYVHAENKIRWKNLMLKVCSSEEEKTFHGTEVSRGPPSSEFDGSFRHGKKMEKKLEKCEFCHRSPSFLSSPLSTKNSPGLGSERKWNICTILIAFNVKWLNIRKISWSETINGLPVVICGF